jgi:hypothetical protein
MAGYPFCNRCVNARGVRPLRPLFAARRIASKSGNFLHHQFSIPDDGQQEFDSKQVEFDGHVVIRTFCGKPQSLSARL